MFCCKCVNKLRLWYEGALKYLGESVTGMKFGLRKRHWRGLDVFIVNGDSDIDDGWCTNDLQHFLCACAVVFLPEDQSRWLWHYEMMSWCSLVLLWEGNYKRRAHTNLGAVIWGFGYWMVGSINKSQTLYSAYPGVSHGAEHNQNELHALFVHMHVPRIFGEPF